MNIKTNSSKWYIRWAITVFLITTFITFTPQSEVRAQQNDGKKSMIAGIFLLGFGTIVVLGLWYVSKKLPPPPGTCGCGCGAINCSCQDHSDNLVSTVFFPTNGPAIVTNPPSVSRNGTSASVMSQIQYSTQSVRPDGGSLTDGKGNLWTYIDSWGFTLQSSTNLPEWRSIYTINGWDLNTGGVLLSVLSNDVPVYAAYYTIPNNPTNIVPIEFTSGLKPKEFFRTVCK